MAKQPWGGAGAWAAESERAEFQAELPHPQQYHQQQASSVLAGDMSFPSLNEAAQTKTPKKKKQTISLAAFIAGGPTTFSESKGLTTEEKMALPSGPRDRSSEDETLGALGGGFRDYGGYRGEGRDRDYGRDREGGYSGRRSDREGGFGGGGFAGDRDIPEGPSRADIADDWGASKKAAPPSRNKSDDRDFPSRADDDSHWGSSKKFVPAPPAKDGSGRVSKYDFSSTRNSAQYDSGSDSDSWAASKKSAPTGGYVSLGQRDRDFWNLRDKARTDTNSWGHKDADPILGMPTERPRLVLQPRSQLADSSPPLPSKEYAENEPSASETSLEQPTKPQKVNPFGEAKPRKVIVEEKGMSWKKLDQGFEQKTSERGDGAELALKEEIKSLQDSLKLTEADSPGNAHATELHEQLGKKNGEFDQVKATTSDQSSGPGGGGDRVGSKEPYVWSRQRSNIDSGLASENRSGRW